MNAEEKEIFDYLKTCPRIFVSANEVSKRVGNRKKYLEDRTWARPLLRRMELDGLLETNNLGEYRLSAASGETTTFLKALSTPVPGVALSDTTIILLEDVDETEQDKA